MKHVDLSELAPNSKKPAPPILPMVPSSKWNWAFHASPMPLRRAKPTPAARMAMNPAQSRRMALGEFSPEEEVWLMELLMVF